MTLAELMAVSRERELTDAEQSRVIDLAGKQRRYYATRDAYNAARRRDRSKSDVARLKARDCAGRFIPQCLSAQVHGDTAGSGA